MSGPLLEVLLYHNSVFPSLCAGNVEENDSVSRALSRLSEVQEKVEGLHQEQVRGRRGVGGTVGKGKEDGGEG